MNWVRRYGSAVYWVCRRVLGDLPTWPEDAVQAVIRCPSPERPIPYDPAAAVGGWLYGVARKAAGGGSGDAGGGSAVALPGELPERSAHAPREPDDTAMRLVDAEIAELPRHSPVGWWCCPARSGA